MARTKTRLLLKIAIRAKTLDNLYGHAIITTFKGGKTMELNKKQKADIMCYVINFGLWDYFDNCKWNEKTHSYRYVNAQEDKICYFTQKSLADYFDKELKQEERKQFIEDYLKREEKTK